MRPQHLLIAAAVLVTVGLFLILFPFNDVELECADGDQVTSGLIDEESGCPISRESFEELRAKESRFKVERVGGLGLVIVGLSLAGVGTVRVDGGRSWAEPRPNGWGQDNGLDEKMRRTTCHPQIEEKRT